MKTILVLFFVVASGFAVAADWKPLEGVYAVTPQAQLTPPTPEVKALHYQFRLVGDSAKDLYYAINAEDMIDECSAAKAKQLSNIRCLYFKKTDQYECRFSINLNDNEIVDEISTC